MFENPVIELERLVRAAALEVGVSLQIDRGRADGFGLVDTEILTVTSTDESGTTIRVWNEGAGDFWLEINDLVTAAWWRQGRKEATLAQVIVALAEGRFRSIDGRIEVSPRDHRPLILPVSL